MRRLGGVSRASWGGCGGVLRRLGGVFGVLERLEVSWGVFEASWGALEASVDHLDPSLEVS